VESGVEKKAKQKKSARMAVKAERSVEPPLLRQALREEWIARIGQLQNTLTVCPTDTSTWCELAMLLEKLGQSEEALLNWNAVLGFDPNSLKAREGVARCRQRTGRPPQSAL
jgi:Flp pilus assembly protein TadD